jgi:uncharacterized damage-inducible protein DinB
MENCMLRNHFVHLFKYNDWATRECAESILKLKKKSEKAEEILSHLISAQQIWLNRVLERDVVTDPWNKLTEEEWLPKSIPVTAEWINFLEGLHENDFEKRIKYTNTKGNDFTNTIKDVIVQVLNHSTYHRAQIALLIRQAGGEPAKTDYIFYQRQLQK